MHAGLSVTGEGVRSKDPSCPEVFPRYMRGCSLIHFCYSLRDGEWLPHTQSYESDEESDNAYDEESDEESDVSSAGDSDSGSLLSNDPHSLP